MKRRRFLFWLGFGMFGLAEKLRADGLDELAAAMMRATEPTTAVAPDVAPEHWTAASNSTWRWFERENLIDGRWTLTGVTTPINKKTGEPYTGRSGYLDHGLVPADLRRVDQVGNAGVGTDASDENDPGRPNAFRRARHGRPPSKWLRSLHADEIRIWLKTIDVPEADVSGMTFFAHLTQHHSFDAKNVATLAVAEQAKLHAAAHYGY